MRKWTSGDEVRTSWREVVETPACFQASPYPETHGRISMEMASTLDLENTFCLDDLGDATHELLDGRQPELKWSLITIKG